MMTDGSSMLATARFVPIDLPQQQQSAPHSNTEPKHNIVPQSMLAPTVSNIAEKQPQQLPAVEQPHTTNVSAQQTPTAAHTDDAHIPASSTAAEPSPPPADQPATGMTRLERETALFMLGLLSKYKEADPFRQPVDWQALGIPDYPVVIKQPMDLKTAREKVRSGAYASMDEWRADMALIWSNCRKYNGPEHPVTKMAEKLEAAMERRMEESVAGAKRELAAQQQRAAEAKGLGRPKVPRELALLRAGNPPANGSDSDGGDDVKPLARVASGQRLGSMAGSRLDQARSSDTAPAACKSPTDNVLRLSLKRAASGGALQTAAAATQNAAPGATDNKAAGTKRKAANNGGGGMGAAGTVPGVDYDCLELLSSSQAAKQLGVSDADDLAFLAVWKKVVARRSQAAAEAEALRQSNKKLKRSIAVSDEEAKALRAKLDAEAAARAAAEKRLEELEKEHAHLQQQHKQQHQVLEHQRQLLEQQQQVLRQVLRQQQQQQQSQQQPIPPQQQQRVAPQQQPQPSRPMMTSQQAAPVLHREPSPYSTGSPALLDQDAMQL